jgi:hypothetical protein
METEREERGKKATYIWQIVATGTKWGGGNVPFLVFVFVWFLLFLLFFA